MESGVFSVLTELLDIIVPVASVFISYFLGRSQGNRKSKAEQAERRYNNFYVPFFTSLYAGRLWERAPSSMCFEARNKILDMLSHNISLLGLGTQMLYADFLSAHSAMLWYENGDHGYDFAPSEYDRIFTQIVESAIAESKQLSKALFLPCIAQSYEIYLRKARECKPTKAQAKQ